MFAASITGYRGGFKGLGSLGSLSSLSALTLVDAITRQENTPSSLNNPGALTAAPSSYCQTGKVNGIVQFCTPQDGIDALNNQIQLDVNRGMTLQQLFDVYAPAAAGNDPTTYTNNVSSWTGIDPNVPLNSVDSSMLYSIPSLSLSPTFTDTVYGLVDPGIFGSGFNLSLTNTDGSVNWLFLLLIGIVAYIIGRMMNGI